MNKKLVIALVAVLVVIGLGVGTFFIIKAISDENHKKDIEMAADCARSFEVESYTINSSNFDEVIRQERQKRNETDNRRRTKRQECAEKYHVTHQEIIDKIGEENYSPR